MRTAKNVIPVVLLFLAAFPMVGAAAQGDPPPMAPGDRDQYLAELASLDGSDWRQVAALAHRLADLPPDQGYALLAEAWDGITDPMAKQQILKGFYFKGPMPLRTRLRRSLLIPVQSLRLTQWIA